MIQDTKYKRGFTLIELLVVVAILGILASVGLGQFFTAQKRGRDTQRKESLASIARALEMYYNDHKQYPSSSGSDGNIMIPGVATIDWGGEFTDGKTTYMKQLPKDPADNFQYYYETDGNHSLFKLYALLEHSEDPDRGGPYSGTDCDSKTAGEQNCNYCLASANASCD